MGNVVRRFPARCMMRRVLGSPIRVVSCTLPMSYWNASGTDPSRPPRR